MVTAMTRRSHGSARLGSAAAPGDLRGVTSSGYGRGTADVSTPPAMPPAGTKKTPSRLSNTEKALAGMLMIAGVAVVIIVLALFLTDGKWLVEETTTTGDGATKRIETKKYSDTLPLAAVSVGGLLVLCGAFFGRLREITLPGGAGIKIGDAQEQVNEKIDARAQEAAAEGQIEPDKIEALKDAARKEASVLVLDKVRETSTLPEPDELDAIAKDAVEKAKAMI
jgi:hypothetical protein